MLLNMFKTFDILIHLFRSNQKRSHIVLQVYRHDVCPKRVVIKHHIPVWLITECTCINRISPTIQSVSIDVYVMEWSTVKIRFKTTPKLRPFHY